MTRISTNERAAASDLIHAGECYKIVGACFEVYNEKGSGFLEPVYHDCLELELALQNIPFHHEPLLPLTYKGRAIKHRYSPDFICWDKVIVEVKAEPRLVDAHTAQLLNYLNATGHALGILVNFGHHPGLEWKRIVRSSGKVIRADSRNLRADS